MTILEIKTTKNPLFDIASRVGASGDGSRCATIKDELDRYGWSKRLSRIARDVRRCAGEVIGG